MNRRDFWIMYAQKTGVSQARAKVLCKSVFEFLADTLDGLEANDRLYIAGLGTFKKKKTRAHRIKDVNSGEMIELPEKEKIVFEATEQPD